MRIDKTRIRIWFSHLADEVRHLLRLNTPSRPWHIAFVASVCMAIPVFAGAYYGRMDYALLVCMGTLVILYLPKTALVHRMQSLMMCTFGFLACFTLAIVAGINPYLSTIVLALTVVLVEIICRYYSISPPGSFFFIFMATIGSTLPFDVALIPVRIGLLALGCMLSCLVAFIYTLIVFPGPVLGLTQPSKPSRSKQELFLITLEAGVVGFFVGGSYLLSLMLKLPNPYWVPVSCLAIMQGANFRSVWHRNIHRITGTALGMGLAWMVFSLSLNVWTYAVSIVLLNFIVESLVVRNYGLAVIFITPMTMLFAEGGTIHIPPETLVMTRLSDIVIGSVVGFVGGSIMHHPGMLSYAARKMKAAQE